MILNPLQLYELLCIIGFQYSPVGAWTKSNNNNTLNFHLINAISIEGNILKGIFPNVYVREDKIVGFKLIYKNVHIVS